jgi:indolepyruvate ferredoxin oxidoreductase beta subunit
MNLKNVTKTNKKSQNIILAGVGGQGILSIAYVLDHAAMDQDLFVKQAEVHGMAQRGGAVQSHVRLSVDIIYSDLIPHGQADLILSVEPLEALRYLEFMHRETAIVTSASPLINIPDYPALETIYQQIREFPHSLIVDSEQLAKEAGSIRSQNMVMLGAAAPWLMIEADGIRKYIKALFESKGEKMVTMNINAFESGLKAAENYLAKLK